MMVPRLLAAIFVDTIIVDIEFDPAKDRRNIARHGVSLAVAERFDMDTALVVPDDRENYGEARWRAAGFIADVLHVLVFTERNDRIRPISLRRAEKSEERFYVSQKTKFGF